MKKILSTIKNFFRGFGTLLAVILSTTATLLCFSIIWMFQTWSNLSMDELMYHLTAPLEGTNESMIQEYLNSCAVPAILILFLVVILFTGFRKRKKVYNLIMAVCIIVPLLAAGKSVSYAWDNLDVGTYVADQGVYSTFIDENYVDPRDTDISFPEQKRNLIYIFLESMETTYADKENGGAFDQNVIPELTALAQENENFAGDSQELNGGYSMPGTTWTMAAMFAQTSGLPLSISIEDNSMDTQDSFFSNVVTLGDVLKQAGYSQSLLIGSDAVFGGRELYFTEHGNFDILDYKYAQQQGWIPEDYRVFWGYEDKRLFQFAKDRLLELADGESPFNLTLLTVDTHFEDGYKCELCPDTFGDDQYSNVMACSSRQIADFISWIQQQSFYENTTIVLSGDHPTMDVDFCEDVDEDYTRKVYTAYINPAVEKEVSDRRNFTTFDNYPTILASMGAEFEGNRLGLGTNLFSAEPTLTERYGIDFVKKELSRKSKLMEELGNLDEEKPALLIREGKAPKAEITPGDYDPSMSLFPVTVNNFENFETEIVSVEIAVWTKYDQSDLQWIQLERQEDGSYYTTVDVSTFDYKNGDYPMDAYARDINGEAFQIGHSTGHVNQ
ncbi:MAG: GBS Bsp-like repeat-containing protein [Muricomes sp.]|uniref:GBS Bsp-like repeat-containing protein n=1 Tax=Faecalicatena contorta TaxID=39482 RepID=UPI002E9B98D3|nr:GBS Bsp-like repeat-containing protein [Muricomes sp.]